MKLPPGLQPYTLKGLAAKVVVPIAAVVALARALRLATQGAVTLPTWLVALLAVLSVPALHAGRTVQHRWSVRLRARRMGAVLPPRWDGKRFGNLDILEYSLDRYHHGYIGASCVLWSALRSCGHCGRAGGCSCGRMRRQATGSGRRSTSWGMCTS